MKKNITLILIAGLLSIKVVLGQTPSRKVDKAEETWFQYYNTLSFNKNFSLKSDIGFREDFPFNNLKQMLVRNRAYYNVHPQATLGVGVAYFMSEERGVMRPEVRPYQELELKGTRFGFLEVAHRFRLEERFFQNVTQEGVPSGADFNYRARYRILLQRALSQKELADAKFFLSVYDEVMLNFGDQIVYNVLNNNRLGVGIGYQINEGLRVIPTYVFQIGQRASGNTFTHTHILWLTLYQNIKLKK